MEAGGKVFVTGATGFIGTRLVQALTDQLGGVLELERRRGASILVRFPATRHP